jgi:glycosyltransferase involved in cell wall biosynthesis
MSYNNSISIIIPSNHCYDDLLYLIKSICIQTLKPLEIIIIDSNITDNREKIKKIFLILESNSINLIYKHYLKSYPGHARNLGFNLSQGEIIAFLDVKTIPSPNWLEKSVEMLITDSKIEGVFGSTSFCADTVFEQLIRDSFFGILPRKTLPGSLFKRDLLYKSGEFIEWVRAGEDTEWMLRIKLLKKPIIYIQSNLIQYIGLKNISLTKLIQKWYRNYSASYELPHYFTQKLLLWLVLYPLIIFIAFNWNYLFANWIEDSPFYLAHITKISIIIPIFIYILIRGIVLPFHRGVLLKNIIPFRFVFITLITFIADLVKILAFTKLKYKSKNGIN